MILTIIVISVVEFQRCWVLNARFLANTNKRTQRKSLCYVNTMNDSMQVVLAVCQNWTRFKNNVCHELKVYQNQIAKTKKKWQLLLE